MGAYSLIDLFAGCGGLTLGFEMTGKFCSILAVECDTGCRRHVDDEFRGPCRPDGLGTPMTIEQVPQFPEADVVVGGPPCQGFSQLNMNGVGLERRALWREYLRAIERVMSNACS